MESWAGGRLAWLPLACEQLPVSANAAFIQLKERAAAPCHVQCALPHARLYLVAMALQVLAAKEVEIGFDAQLRETFVKEAIILHQVSALCSCFFSHHPRPLVGGR